MSKPRRGSNSSDVAPRQFIPYLYFLSSTRPNTSHGTVFPESGSWTHTVRLLPCTKTRPAGSSDLSHAADCDVSRGLDLYVPGSAFKSGNRDLALTQDQLLLARDFLALALPYYASAHPSAHLSSGCPWPDSLPSSACVSSISTAGTGTFPGGPCAPLSLSESELSPGESRMPRQQRATPPPPSTLQADAVRVLLQGPPHALLAIGLTYIAYASGCEVAQVVRGVLQDSDAESMWAKLLLGEDGRGEMALAGGWMGMLERAAIQGL